MACFADIYLSQGSVATYTRCGGSFNIRLTTNLPMNFRVKNFPNRSRFDRTVVMSLRPNFLGDPVNELTMKTHVQQTASRCFATFRQLRSIRRRIPTSVFNSLISALVLGRLDYCNSLLIHLPLTQIQRLHTHTHTPV